VSSQTKEGLRKLVADIRESAAREGRGPRDIKFFMGVTAVAGGTEAEAREKHADYLRYANPEAGLAHYASSTGIDFSRYGPDEPIRYVKNNAIESAVKNLTVARTDRTVRDLLADMALGGRYPALVGSAAQIADELESWVAETDIDGFNLARTVTPECYEDFIDLVIPELQSRGSYKTAYADGPLREKLFGPGRGRLPEAHAGAAPRAVPA
jgi:alkanesulfonate monooxygenase SsuD/methylene tetrahydromethanopterin reductase-like flavin-dependent oxidoreductase (luciferase family)